MLMSSGHRLSLRGHGQHRDETRIETGELFKKKKRENKSRDQAKRRGKLV